MHAPKKDVAPRWGDLHQKAQKWKRRLQAHGWIDARQRLPPPGVMIEYHASYRFKIYNGRCVLNDQPFGDIHRAGTHTFFLLNRDNGNINAVVWRVYILHADRMLHRN